MGDNFSPKQATPTAAVTAKLSPDEFTQCHLDFMSYLGQHTDYSSWWFALLSSGLLNEYRGCADSPQRIPSTSFPILHWSPTARRFVGCWVTDSVVERTPNTYINKGFNILMEDVSLCDWLIRKKILHWLFFYSCITAILNYTCFGLFILSHIEDWCTALGTGVLWFNAYCVGEWHHIELQSLWLSRLYQLRLLWTL